MEKSRKTIRHLKAMRPVLCAVLFLPLALFAAARNQFELKTSMTIDVDGAPNAYGPPGKKTLDYERNAHKDNLLRSVIVGYLTQDDGRTPLLQGAGDPCPGYYISTTAFSDRRNGNERDPRKYLDATRINYVVLGKAAARAGAQVGDFVAVYSERTHRSVFGIVGDSGNPTGAEGSLALLQALGYPFTTGKTGEVERKEIIVRYFPGSNPEHQFFDTQANLDAAAASLGLSKDFTPTRRGK
jgi:hypothetical protein